MIHSKQCMSGFSNCGLLTSTVLACPCWAAIAYRCIPMYIHAVVVKYTDAFTAALIPWEQAWGSKRADSEKQLNWHISHAYTAVWCNSFIKQRWNGLKENSSRSRLSRNNTLPGFVSICFGLSVSRLKAWIIWPTHSLSPQGLRYLTRPQPSASTWFSSFSAFFVCARSTLDQL